MIDGPRKPRPSVAPAKPATVAKPPPKARPSTPPPAKKFNDAYSTGRARALQQKTTGFTATSTTKGGTSITPADGGISLSANGSFSTELKNAKGYGVSFGVSAQASVVTKNETKDGVTSFSVSTDASVSITGGANTPQAGLTVGHTEGIKASYEVRMPEAAAKGVNPATVSPFDPMSMPTGTVITMNGSQYSTNEFKATFKNLALATKVTNESGVSVAVEKTGATTVRVTAGPTAAIDAYNGVGVDFGVAGVMLGRNDKLASATLKTAEFDLATPEGKAAYNDFLANGTLPKDNGKGISNVATIEKLDYSSQTRLDANLGPLEISLGGAQNTGARVETTLPDGTKSVSVDLQYSGNVPMNITQKFDKNGKEILSERRYTYSLQADDNNTQLLNVAITGDVNKAQSGPVKPGQTVTMQFTEEQMRQYMTMTQKASDAGMGYDELDVLVKDYDDKLINSPEDFALALGRNLNGGDYAQAERMFNISDAADGQYDGEYTKLPGTFVVS
ncbi:MAG: hypothetical protein Q8L48_31040 [Archangium sp.]|nr:hypothetical protein [Archangium sp.]